MVELELKTSVVYMIDIYRVRQKHLLKWIGIFTNVS